MIRPSGYACSSCPYWDDINGCWANAMGVGDSEACYEEGGACHEEDFEEDEHEAGN